MVDHEDYLFVKPAGKTLNETDYKVMQNSCGDYLVPCQKIRVNGETELCYLTDDMVSLQELFQRRDYHAAATCICGIADAVGHVQMNGFLSIRNLIPDAGMIFTHEKGVSLAYMPCVSQINQDEEHFWRSLCSSVLHNAEECGAEAVATAVRELLTGNELSGECIRAKLLTMCGTQMRQDSYSKRKAMLITRIVDEIFTLEIDRRHYVIGKNPELADGVIDFNNAVSRKHCCIDCIDDQYTVTDLRSSNGTYVNEVRAEPCIPVSIADGDVLTLANCTFVFRTVK